VATNRVKKAKMPVRPPERPPPFTIIDALEFKDCRECKKSYLRSTGRLQIYLLQKLQKMFEDLSGRL